MPTYEYRCKDCNHLFETLQTMSAPHLTTCPKCHKETLKRLIGTGGGILFKGSGFYQTDYRSSSYEQGHKSESTPKSESSAPKSDS
jgi:putative FmdB family regulatory protein